MSNRSAPSPDRSPRGPNVSRANSPYRDPVRGKRAKAGAKSATSREASPAGAIYTITAPPENEVLASNKEKDVMVLLSPVGSKTEPIKVAAKEMKHTDNSTDYPFDNLNDDIEDLLDGLAPPELAIRAINKMGIAYYVRKRDHSQGKVDTGGSPYILVRQTQVKDLTPYKPTLYIVSLPKVPRLVNKNFIVLLSPFDSSANVIEIEAKKIWVLDGPSSTTLYGMLRVPSSLAGIEKCIRELGEDYVCKREPPFDGLSSKKDQARENRFRNRKGLLNITLLKRK